MPAFRLDDPIFGFGVSIGVSSVISACALSIAAQNRSQ